MLRVQNLGFCYGQRLVLKDISFTAHPGQCLAILGNNGAGKSTLIKCIGKILTPHSGTVLLGDGNLLNLSLSSLAKKVAYVSQSYETTRFTVFDTILLGRKPYIRFTPSPRDYALVEDLLEKLGLTSLAMAYIDELSGGELQQVMLARALAQEPQLLLLDEPTSNLDLKNQHHILRLVRQIAKSENICVILVIHDINLALQYCDRFLLIKDHGIYACGGKEVVSAKAIADVYGLSVTLEDFQGVRMVVPTTFRDKKEEQEPRKGHRLLKNLARASV
jgi:iron complex transport system ATP-binding protein